MNWKTAKLKTAYFKMGFPPWVRKQYTLMAVSMAFFSVLFLWVGSGRLSWVTKILVRQSLEVKPTTKSQTGQNPEMLVKTAPVLSVSKWQHRRCGECMVVCWCILHLKRFRGKINLVFIFNNFISEQLDLVMAKQREMAEGLCSLQLIINGYKRLYWITEGI